MLLAVPSTILTTAGSSVAFKFGSLVLSMSSTCFFVTLPSFFLFFFFNDTATTAIYTLSLHDALPISWSPPASPPPPWSPPREPPLPRWCSARPSRRWFWEPSPHWAPGRRSSPTQATWYRHWSSTRSATFRGSSGLLR